MALLLSFNTPYRESQPMRPRGTSVRLRNPKGLLRIFMIAHLFTLVRQVKRALGSATCGPSILFLMPKHSVESRMLYPNSVIASGQRVFAPRARFELATFRLTVERVESLS